MSGLVFLNDLLEDMPAEREPNFSEPGGSFSAGTERRGSVTSPPGEAADTVTDLTASPSCTLRGVAVRRLEDQYRDESCTPVRIWTAGELLAAENQDNFAIGADIFLPCRTHEEATEVNMFIEFS